MLYLWLHHICISRIIRGANSLYMWLQLILYTAATHSICGCNMLYIWLHHIYF